MECNVPTDIVFSFSGLALRGGVRGPHADGWGLALYEGRAVRTFLEPAAAAESKLAAYVRSHPIKTLLAIAHVRKRTRGPVSLANTHPFVRELWGRHFTFAHNGTVRGVKRHKLDPLPPHRHHRQRVRVLRHPRTGSTARSLAVIRKTARGSIGRSRASARSSARAGRSTSCWATASRCSRGARRSSATSSARRRSRRRRSRTTTSPIDFSEVTTPRDRVAIVATAPLTRDETWTIGRPGEMWVFRRGQLAATLRS